MNPAGRAVMRRSRASHFPTLLSSVMFNASTWMVELSLLEWMLELRCTALEGAHVNSAATKYSYPEFAGVPRRLCQFGAGPGERLGLSFDLWTPATAKHGRG